jgi:hypothetical protein
VTLRPAADAARGELILIEPGGAAQVIPVSVPGRATGPSAAAQGEAFDFGIDAAALDRIARQTGGIDLSERAPALARSTPPPLRDPLHPAAIALALVLLAASLWSRRRSN